MPSEAPPLHISSYLVTSASELRSSSGSPQPDTGATEALYW